MKDVIVTRHKYHIVRSLPGCTVRQEGANGTVIETTVPANEDTPVFAHSGRWAVEGDENVTVTEVFKLAPQQKLALLGVLGGNDGLPAGYTRLDYIQSLGGQYIDTLFYLPPNVEAEAVLSFSKIKPYLFANYGSEVSAYLLFGPLDKLGRFWAVDGAVSLDLYAPVPIQLREFFHLRLGLGHSFFNGLPMISPLQNQITIDAPPRTLTLFARNHKNGTVTSFTPGCIRSFVLRADGRLLRKYQPCLSPTGVPGLFDLVEKQFFSNSGTGDFLYPTASSTYSLRRVLPDWGKLTERGLRRLYHAPKNYKGELIDYALENGYKPLIEAEKPETGYWSPQWRETDEEIVLDWVETEPPTEDYLTQPTE